MTFLQRYPQLFFTLSFIFLSCQLPLKASDLQDPDEGRADLTALRFVTIDPEGAHELDDALYAERTYDGGFHIAIAIANPTYYIPAYSEVAQLAKRRCTTRYGRGAPRTMLPGEIAKACSLEEGKDRPALVVDLYVDEKGNFTTLPLVYQALIQSRHKLSYDYVQAVYEGRWRRVINPELKGDLTVLREAAQALRFYKIGHKKTLCSQDVVSEMMVAANNAVAMCLKTMVKGGDIERGLYRSQGTSNVSAHYTSNTSYHASLDLTYTHFTSPLRRYADMMVHWILFDKNYTYSDDTLMHIDGE